MKYNITKISGFILSLFLVFTACETEESLNITSPDAAFELQEPGISNVFLNFGIPDNNAFTISWNDEVTGSSSYDVQMSLEDTFANPVNVGSSDSNSFSISVNDLNAAINSAGAMSFNGIAVYVRVNAGGTFSNSILFLVTTYPTDAPVLTNPLANDSFVLSIGSLDDVVMTVEWTDAALASGETIIYTVEAAAAGTDFAAPVVAATTEDALITGTHSEVNAVAIGVGLSPEVAGDVDLRVIARITNTGGNVLERISETVTVSITPYTAAFPNLYLVGDATTPGWSPDNNNTPLFRNQDVPNAYVYTGYFNAGAFKLLEVIGQWQPQWGTNDGSTLAVNPGGGSDPGTFNVATAGYYTYNFTTVGESGSFTVSPYDASGAATYSTMGIIGDAIGGWGDGDEINFTQDANDPHIWYALAVNFTYDVEFLIRANDGWDNVWRYTGSEELYGTAFLGSGNNFPFTEPTGSYDVWFNDLDGGYVIIPN